jgi:hypothetical protein
MRCLLDETPRHAIKQQSCMRCLLPTLKDRSCNENGASPQKNPGPQQFGQDGNAIPVYAVLTQKTCICLGANASRRKLHARTRLCDRHYGSLARGSFSVGCESEKNAVHLDCAPSLDTIYILLHLLATIIYPANLNRRRSPVLWRSREDSLRDT